MRITGGALRGRKLIESRHLKNLRPTTDKNRENLFNILQNSRSIKDVGFSIDGSTILDVCSGTGSVSIEFLSRGASRVTMLDNNKLHLALAKENAKCLGVLDKAEFLLEDVFKNALMAEKEPLRAPFSSVLRGRSFDLIFIDPPYEVDALPLLSKFRAICSKLLVVESSSKTANAWRAPSVIDQRTYGISSFTFFDCKNAS